MHNSLSTYRLLGVRHQIGFDSVHKMYCVQIVRRRISGPGPLYFVGGPVILSRFTLWTVAGHRIWVRRRDQKYNYSNSISCMRTFIIVEDGHHGD